MNNLPILNIKQNRLEKNRTVYVSPLIIIELNTLRINGEIDTTKFTTLAKELTLFPDSGNSIIL